MKCAHVQDLLTNYISDLTTEETKQDITQHLTDCASCQQEYETLSKPLDDLVAVTTKNKQEVRFLKKLQRRTWKIIGVSMLSLVLVVAVILKVFVFGFPIHSDNVAVETSFADSYMRVQESDDMTWQTIAQEDWMINVETTNGKLLRARMSTIRIEDSVVGNDVWLYELPTISGVMGVSNGFSFGFSRTEIPEPIVTQISKSDLSNDDLPTGDGDYTVRVHYKDQITVYTFKGEQ